MNTFWPKIKENPLFAALLAILLITLVISLTLWARNMAKQNYYIGKNPQVDRSISITGEGKVTTIPDIAYISLGLNVVKPKVADAQGENSKTMNTLISQLKALGIDSKDIQTTSYSIYPNYNYPNNKQVLSGYTVYQEIKVKLRQTDKIDKVLQLAGNLNLNQVGNLSFDVDQPETFRQQARILALQNAKSKAEALAQVMGVNLGKVISFSESEGYNPSPNYSGAEMGGGGAVPPPSIQSGSQEIDMTATVTYELN